MLTLIVSNRPQAIEVHSFGQLLNLLDYSNRSIEVRSSNAQIAGWPTELVSKKIQEMVGIDVQVVRI